MKIKKFHSATRNFSLLKSDAASCKVLNPDFKIKRIAKNNYLDALFKLMLLSAIIHIAILVLYSIINLNIKKLDFFDIIGVYLFFPSMNDNLLFMIIGTILMIILYVLFLIDSRN